MGVFAVESYIGTGFWF